MSDFTIIAKLLGDIKMLDNRITYQKYRGYLVKILQTIQDLFEDPINSFKPKETLSLMQLQFDVIRELYKLDSEGTEIK